MTQRTKLDDLQLALDVAGLEPTIGTGADAANAVISLLRAAKDKEPDERNKHLLDAGISAVSMIPFADVVKLLKLRKLRKVAVKGARVIKTGAKEMPKSYSDIQEGWLKDVGKAVKKNWKPWLKHDVLGFEKPIQKGVAKSKARSTAIEKDPYNAGLWIQKLLPEKERHQILQMRAQFGKSPSPDQLQQLKMATDQYTKKWGKEPNLQTKSTWDAKKEKWLKMAYGQQQTTFGKTTDDEMNRSAADNIFYQWARLNPQIRAVYDQEVGNLQGWAKLAKQQEILKRHALDQAKRATQGQDWVQQQNALAGLAGGGNPQAQVSQSDIEGIPDASPEQVAKYYAQHRPKPTPYLRPSGLRMTPSPQQPPAPPYQPPPSQPIKMAPSIPLPPQPTPAPTPQPPPLRMAPNQPAAAHPAASIIVDPPLQMSPSQSLKRITRPASSSKKAPTTGKKVGTTKAIPTAGKKVSTSKPAPKGTKKTMKESISKSDLLTILRDIISEEIQEGVGHVYSKDIHADPKHTVNKTTGKDQRWTIKFASTSDLTKHGDKEKTPVSEDGEQDTISKKELNEVIRELVNEMWVGWQEGKGQVKEYDKVHSDKLDPEKCSKCGDEYLITQHPNPHNLCPDCATMASSEDQYARQDFQGNIDEGMAEGQPIVKDKEKITQLISSLKEGEYIWFSFDKQGRSGHGYGVEKKVEGDEFVYRTTGEYGEYLETDEDIDQFVQNVIDDKYVHYYFIDTIQGYQKQSPRYSQDDDQQVGDYEKYGPDPIRWQDVYEQKSLFREIVKQALNEIRKES